MALSHKLHGARDRFRRRDVSHEAFILFSGRNGDIETLGHLSVRLARDVREEKLFVDERSLRSDEFIPGRHVRRRGVHERAVQIKQKCRTNLGLQILLQTIGRTNVGVLVLVDDDRDDVLLHRDVFPQYARHVRLTLFKLAILHHVFRNREEFRLAREPIRPRVGVRSDALLLRDARHSTAVPGRLDVRILGLSPPLFRRFLETEHRRANLRTRLERLKLTHDVAVINSVAIHQQERRRIGCYARILERQRHRLRRPDRRARQTNHPEPL